MTAVKHVFAGFGFGPIQAGLFAKEAAESGRFSEIAVSEVDPALVAAVRGNGDRYALNVAWADRVEAVTVGGVRLLNPNDAVDLPQLRDVLGRATELVTSLPSVAFYLRGGETAVARLIADGLRERGAAQSVVYTAENNNHAAELLEREVSELAAAGQPLRPAQMLNTVIGKMSQVITDPAEIARRGLAPIAPGFPRAFLVESFNRILVSRIALPGFGPGITAFEEKSDLLPFEEAKLYGHNAIHLLLGLHASQKGLRFMHELSAFGDIIETGRRAFIDESGKALCKKWSGADELFREDGFKGYAEDLLQRMMNPFLQDQVDRVCRDMERKLGWNDRIIGTIRLILRQGFTPSIMAESAAIAATRLFGKDPGEIRKGLGKLWNDAPINEQNELQNLICKKLQP